MHPAPEHSDRTTALLAAEHTDKSNFACGRFWKKEDGVPILFRETRLYGVQERKMPFTNDDPEN